MAQYDLSDLPSFGDVKNNDPQEFIFQFNNFLNYIGQKVTTPAEVEKAISLFGSCMHNRARIWFETHVGPTPRNVDGHEVKRTVAQWQEILKDFARNFHPLGKTTEQLEMAWNNLRWQPSIESIEDFAEKVNQLAHILNKSQADQVIKIKMACPDKSTYQMIMGCTSVDEIVTIVNQLQAMSWLKPSNPLQVLSAQHDDVRKTVSFAKETTMLYETPDWPERIGDRIASKVNDKLSKFTQNFPSNACYHTYSKKEYKERGREPFSRKEYRDRDRELYSRKDMDREYDYTNDRCSYYKKRNDWCDGHKQERLRDCYEHGFVRHRYKSPCRYDAKRSERHPNRCADYGPTEDTKKRMQTMVETAHGLIKQFNEMLNN